MPDAPDQLARDRERLEVVTARWRPYLFGSSHADRMTFWKLGKERGELRRRIEAAEREVRERIEVAVVTGGEPL